MEPNPRLLAEGIRKRIRYRQADLRMTQVALAKSMGMTSGVLGKRINGITNWTPEELLRAAVALRVSLSYLYGITDDPGTPPDLEKRSAGSVTMVESIETCASKIEDADKS